MTQYKSTPQILREAVFAYYAKKKKIILASWQPACGCPDPGELPQCALCPGKDVFLQKMQER